MLVVTAGPDHGLIMEALVGRVRPWREYGVREIYWKHCGRVGLEKEWVEEVDWRWVYWLVVWAVLQALWPSLEPGENPC